MDRDELMKLSKNEIITLLLSALSTIEEQSTKITELEARLKQNSRNSSKPSSTDGFTKLRSLRESSGKNPGGQPGHKGSGLKLKYPSDFTEFHHPPSCSSCADADVCMATRHISHRRYEVDIEIKPKITEHQVLQVTCPRTNETLTATFPVGINSTVQYGVNLEALAVSLNTIGMVSLNHTHEILSDVFDIPISTATIATMVKKCANAVLKTVSDVKDAILEEPLIHFDETGIRVDGKIHWGHIACTETLTHISIEEKRGKEGMDTIGILPNYDGTGIHDCWSSYFKYDRIRHGLCCAHLLRDLNAVTENYHQKWAKKLADLLLEMKSTKEKFLFEGLHEAPEHVWQKYSQKYDEIVGEALAQNPLPEKGAKKKRGKVGALVDRLILRKDQWLLFFTDWTVPFTNNLAERGFRVLKVKQKVAGCFRTKEGAQDFARITSFVSTARKRGISPFFAMKDALLGQPFAVR